MIHPEIKKYWEDKHGPVKMIYYGIWSCGEGAREVSIAIEKNSKTILYYKNIGNGFSKAVSEQEMLSFIRLQAFL